MKHSILSALCLLGIVVSATAQYSGGNGNFVSPFELATANDLISLSGNPAHWSAGYYFKLTDNIDMAGKTFTPIGNTGQVFSGSIQGNFHKISNLTITPIVGNDGFVRSGTGLFGAINGSIENLGIVNVSINVAAYSNSSRVGAFAGELVGGTIRNCFAEGGSINVGGGGWTGGLVGCLFFGGSKSVENCWSSVDITAGWGHGGVVGANRGAFIIDRVAYYGKISKEPAIVTVQTGQAGNKEGIPATNAYFKNSNGNTDPNATGLTDADLLNADKYTNFDFVSTWEIDSVKGFATLRVQEMVEPELDFFEKIRYQRVPSDTLVDWKQFGPGMSGYNEEFWCHPTDTNVMFMGPDMHVSYGTWDNGLSWQTLKDWDGDGLDLERVNDITFSTQNPDFGLALERRGKVFKTTNRGRSWELIYLIPQAAASPYYNAHSRITIHPTNDAIWFIGAGGFWNVKDNHRSAASPHGKELSTWAYGYVLKTTDGGRNWNKVATSISDKLDVGRIVIHPVHPDSMVMAAGQGMFLSTDGGETWNPSHSGLPNNLPKDLTSYFNPQTGEYILYTVEQSVYTEVGNGIATTGGVFKSVDGGVSWSSITGNLGLDFTVITDNTFRDRYAGAVGNWLGKDKSVIATKEYPAQTLQVFRRLVVNPNNKNELYLFPNQRHDKSFGPGDLWKTDDGGQTWKIVTKHGTYWRSKANQDYWASKGMTMDTNVEFAHMQRSMDESHEAYSANRNLAINANGHVFIGINQQTHRSNDGGKTWQQVDDYETAPGTNAWIGRGASNLPGRFILHETGIPDRKLLCSGEHGLWQTADLGTWPDKDAVAVRQIEGQVHDHSGNHGAHSISTVAVHPHNPDIIYILMWRQEHRGHVRRSTDGGKTWTNIAKLFDADNGSWENVASQYSLLIDPVNPDNMYFTSIYKALNSGTGGGAGVDLTLGEYGVYRSSDGGYTWTVSNNGFPAKSSINRIVMHPDDPTVFYASSNQWGSNDPFGLYKSTDKTATWNKISIPSQIQSVNNVFIDRQTKYLYISCGNRSGSYEGGGVYRSKDDGKTWEQLFKAPFVWQCETSPVNPDIIVVSAATQVSTLSHEFKNPGIYLSRDGGVKWTKINRGLGQLDKMVDVKPDPYNEGLLWASAWGSGWYKGWIKTDTVAARCKDVEAEENSMVTLYGMGSIGSQLTYKWTAPEGIELSSDNTYKTSFTAPMVEKDTTFVVLLKVSNASDSDTQEVRVTVRNGNTPVKEVAAQNVHLHPNPAKTRLYIAGGESAKSIRVLTVSGREVFRTCCTSELNIAGLKNGLYILQMDVSNGMYTRKFVKG